MIIDVLIVAISLSKERAGSAISMAVTTTLSVLSK